MIPSRAGPGRVGSYGPSRSAPGHKISREKISIHVVGVGTGGFPTEEDRAEEHSRRGSVGENVLEFKNRKLDLNGHKTISPPTSFPFVEEESRTTSAAYSLQL